MKAALISSAVLWSAVSTYGATPAYWLGGDGSYATKSKWSTGVVPTTTAYDAIIGTAGQVAMSSSASVNSLTLSNAAAVVNFNSSGVFQAGTLDVAAGAFNLQYGTLKNTIVTAGSNGGQFVFYSTAPTLDNVTLATSALAFYNANVTVNNNLTVSGSVPISAGNSFGFNSCSLIGNGEVVVNSQPNSSNARATFAGNAFTIGPNVTVRTGTFTGGSGEIVLGDTGTQQTDYSFVNQGTISCETDPMTVTVQGTWANTGKLRVSAGTLRLGGFFTPAGLGDFVRTGGTVILTGKVDASGQPLRLNAMTGSWDINGTVVGSNTGRINNGRVECSDGTQLNVPIAAAATFDNITLAGKLQMATSSNVRVLNGFTLENGAIVMDGGNVDAPTNLDFTGPTTVGGTANITFNGNTYNQITTYNSTGAVTFGTGIALRADTGGFLVRAVTGSPVTFQGRVTVGSGQQATFNGPVSVTGTTQVETGGTLQVIGGTSTLSSLTNLSNGALTAGAFVVNTNGALRLPGTITTNAATIALLAPSAGIYAGSTGSISALSSLTTNAAAGAIELGSGVRLTLPTALLNRGSITVGPSAVFSATGGLTSPGTLAGVGTIVGDIADAGRIVPGTATTPQGTLSVTGSIALDPAARVEIGLASNTATQNDHFAVTGSLEAAGTLAVTWVNGYSPANGRSFDVLDFAGLTGTFSALELPTLTTGLSWDTSRLYLDGTLSVVPEPASLGCIAAAGTILLRRARQR